MKRKITLIALFLTMVFAMTACAKKSSSSVADNTSKQETDATKDDSTDATKDDSTDKTTPAPTDGEDTDCNTIEEFFALEKNKPVLQDFLDTSMAEYSQYYCDIKINADGNDVTEKYYYLEGTVVDDSAFDSVDFDTFVSQAKNIYRTLTGITPENVYFEYYTADGDLIYSSQTGRPEPDDSGYDTIEEYFNSDGNDDMLAQIIENTLSIYSTTYSNMEIYVHDNEVVERYYYAEGVNADASAFESIDWSTFADTLRETYNSLTGIEPEKVGFEYYTYDGELIFGKTFEPEVL